MLPNALENLARDLPTRPASAVRCWWDGLADADRAALILLYQRPRRPRRVLGRFVESRPHRESLQRNLDFYEYLVNHELSLDDGRRFHICTAHLRAREAVLAGVIPAGFECPLGKGDCPMRAALDHRPGCDIQLRRA